MSADKRVTTSAAIRAALADGRIASLDAIQADVEKIKRSMVNRKKIIDLLGYLTRKGDLQSKGTKEDRTFQLRAPAAAARPTRARSEPATLGELAHKVAHAHGPGLAQQHVLTTLRLLESVREIDVSGALFSAAFLALKEAVELAAS